MSSAPVFQEHDSRDRDAERSDRAAMQASAGGRLRHIAESFERLARRPLVIASPDGIEAAMWNAPRPIMVHGTEPEPRFFYANRIALEILSMRADEFIGTIAHRLAEPLLREESIRLAEGLARHDIVDLYAVVGLAANGRRFTMSNAQIWNIVDRHGGHHGMGATFPTWQFLDRG